MIKKRGGRRPYNPGGESTMKIQRFIHKTLFFFFIFFCLQVLEHAFSILPSSADEPETLTLSAACERALQDNPLVRMTLSGRQIADAQLREARAGWFPLLQFGETFTRGNNPVFVFGSLLEQSRFSQANFSLHALNNPEPLSNFRTALILRQTLFDQLQTFTRVTQARLGQRQADLQKAMVEQQIRFEVIRTYYGVLVAHAKKGVTEEAVKMAESDMKRIQDRFKNGLVVESDLLAAEVQLAEFRQQQIDSEGDVAIAYAALNTVLGLPVQTLQKLAGELEDKRFEAVSQEELVRLALLQRPDYLRAGYSVLSNKEGVVGAKREYLPRLDIFGNYGLSGNDLSSGSTDYTISASLTFNIFDPGRRARIEKAKAAESMATAEQERLANEIRLEVVRAYQQHISARGRLAVAGQVIEQAAETHRIVQNRYREGLTTITEVLRSETALLRARLNLIAARSDHYVSYAHLLLSAGKLTDILPFLS
ncbi:MAG: putative Outer rane efflux protein precursor [Deltaproteobacteria bacterium]|nr:putative Outer rane efflux protein precursor [Deltaproteobacteria bacterium]